MRRSGVGVFVAMVGFVGAAAGQSGQVWVVDPAGPIPQIAAAVALAADGDVILVKPGSYAPVSIVGKSLTIQGDPHAAISYFDFGGTGIADHGLLVRDLAPDQRVVVRNIDVWQSHNEPEAAVAVFDCQGAVQLEDGRFEASHGPGTHVVACTSVTLARCVVLSNGPFQPAGSTTFTLAAGLRQSGSTVFTFDCTITGCAGRSSFPLIAPATSPGGPGLHLTDGVHFASGTSFTGGVGGGHGFGACGPPVQAGGEGLLMEGASTTSLVLLDSPVAGGAGGLPAASCGGLPQGPTGPDQIVLGGTVVEPAATRRAFGLASPVREGQPMLVGYAGEPDDLVWAAVSVGAGSGVLLQPSLLAPHVDLATFALVPIGLVPALTAHVDTLTAPPLPPAVPFALFTVQGVFLDASGELHLGGPTSVLVVDDAL